MRLVNDYETEFHDRDVGLEESRANAFRGYVQKAYVTICGIVKGEVHVPAGHSRIDGYGLDASGVQVLHLVFHKCDKRCNDQCNAVFHKSRDLEAD